MGGNRQKDFKSRTLSITDEMWDQAKKRQKQLGMASISDYIRHLIRVDVEKKGNLTIVASEGQPSEKGFPDDDDFTREILKHARSPRRRSEDPPPADDEDNGKEANG